MRSGIIPALPQNIRLKNILTLLHRRRMAQAPPPKRPIKVLMLHGFTQSGPLFHAKTRALEKNLQKAFPAGITLSYPTAPIRLARTDIPFPVSTTSTTSSSTNEGGADAEDDPDAWAWWRRKGDSEPYVYEGIEQGLDKLAEVLRTEGPFDGVIGFSQGGAMAAMLASLLEPTRREAFEKLYEVGGLAYPESFTADTGYAESALHTPLKFAVCYSGFAARGVDTYRGFYEPKISTPMLHFLGTLDAVVEESRSLALVERCEESEGRVVYHPGGHFLPSSQKAYVSALIGFMKEVLHKAEGETKEEESVHNMDVPF
ncbi:FSH1-domain-containing protein [Lentithecium fluviatile CBS 122367]|uniref:FSH1-domain-containing protein n=1 Tax=Lentithecium fluviatile CBS 122367 TaxID=1168545 RepID=A0A6G1IT81_9PLEO|nr:FSH1-domain-containing protein [Lentithecium fluviatile CBS 122367]